MDDQRTHPQDVKDERDYPAPKSRELAWVQDAIVVPDEGVRSLLATDPPAVVLDQVRLASIGAGLLQRAGLHRFADFQDGDLDDVRLTPEQGRVWHEFAGLLVLLRSSVRAGKDRAGAKGMKFVVCTGCHRFMLTPVVPTAKSCPLRPGCTGPQIVVPPATITSVPTPDEALAGARRTT